MDDPAHKLPGTGSFAFHPLRHHGEDGKGFETHIRNLVTPMNLNIRSTSAAASCNQPGILTTANADHRNQVSRKKANLRSCRQALYYNVY